MSRILVATASHSYRWRARPSSAPNFTYELQSTHGLGVRPSRYAATNGSMTPAANSRSRFIT